MSGTFSEYNRTDILIDIIGYIHLHGETPNYKELMDYGHGKASIVDFCLGMSIPVFNDNHEDLFEQGIDATAISPNNIECLCGRHYGMVDQIYRYDGDDKNVKRETCVIMCGECKKKTEMVENLSPEKKEERKTSQKRVAWH